MNFKSLPMPLMEFTIENENGYVLANPNGTI